MITQHQDCTATVIKAAEAAGIDGRRLPRRRVELAPKGWLTGSEWDWGDLYIDIVKTALAGDFTGSKYNANFRVGYKDGANPFVQSKFGPSVDDETKALIDEAKTTISERRLAVHRPGHRPGRHDAVRRPAMPDYATVEAKNTVFVKGVVGEIPKS